ncbi:MAG: hypothetical protein ABIQ16_05055 [Polyangiaceae bacterium]
MGDERGSANESESLAPPKTSASEPAPPLLTPRPGVQLPPPVTLPPRPSSTPSSLAPRPPGTPPPPPVRSLLRASLTPPPPPNSSFRPPPPSMRPAPPGATPAPPPKLPTPSVAVVATPSVALGNAPRVDGGRVQELLSDLMSSRKQLTEKSTELRKALSERNTLRARLVRAENSTRELMSAFRTEAQLRSEFVDAHAASSAALRARVVELEAALATTKAELRPSEQIGLRRIRGIGPAYERALLGLGITQLTQIAALSSEEILRIAPLIKAQADRILRDDWVGQARHLLDSAPK